MKQLKILSFIKKKICGLKNFIFQNCIYKYNCIFNNLYYFMNIQKLYLNNSIFAVEFFKELIERKYKLKKGWKKLILICLKI